MTAPKQFQWLSDLPTTQIQVLVGLLVVLATALRYLWPGAPVLDNLAIWLTFVSSLLLIGGATVVGKRMTSDPGVIAAEAAARQNLAATVVTSDASGAGVSVTPAPNATQGAPDP